MVNKIFSCDFETTVYDNQTFTEVWASAFVELYTEDVIIHNSISDTFNFFNDLNCNIIAYYHNLKFDGSFWLSYLLQRLHYKQAYIVTNEEPFECYWLDKKDMPSSSFKYSISNMGQWYTITIKTDRGKYIEIRDSLKLLPFSVKKIGESFGTKHKKLEMEYKGYRYAGCEITDEEKQYIANDVLVVKEALEIMFNDGYNKLTIGSCCLSEFKKITGKYDYTNWFPDLYDETLPSFIESNVETIGDYIHKSYGGGWCYLVDGKQDKIYSNGTTADVNSLYPSMMHSKSGNKYPVGKPMFWSGNYIPEKALRDYSYYFIRIKTRFFIKDGYLPFIHIRNNLMYKATESLKTSDVWDEKEKCYKSHYKTIDGDLLSTRVELTLTMTDFELIKEHYNLFEFEIIDGCYFYTMTGIFDEYINNFAKIKMNNKGAKREEAKLFLNNLYGKLASSKCSSFKVAYLNEDNIVCFKQVTEFNKQAGYIPCGSAITSYARNFTIRAAQKNYHGVDNKGFIYADTDSIHCDLKPEEIVGIDVDDKDLCCWKLESCWDKAIFSRQKTYIEHITHENLEKIDKPYYNIKCAGMPQRCKNLFAMSMDEKYVKNSIQDFTEEDKKEIEIRTGSVNDEKLEFLTTKRDLTSFKKGLKITGKLLPKRILGGTLLVETTFEMR